jgi:hypothetical protein
MVVSPDRRLTLSVPANALSVRVHLTIELAEAWPAGALGPVFEVRPSGTTFNAPVTFIYRYQPADISPFPASSVRVAVASGSVWSPLPTTIDVGMGTATATANHLSTYGLVSSDAGTAPQPDGGAPQQEAGTVMSDATRGGQGGAPMAEAGSL